MTDAELRTAAWAELLQSDISVSEWQNRVTNGYKRKPYPWQSTHIGKAKGYLDMIGKGVTPPAVPPTPPAGFSQDWSAGIVSPWNYEGQAASLTTQTNRLTLTVGPGSSGPNPSSFLASAYLNPGANAKANPGDVSIYRVPVTLPVGYQPTSGEWNWLVEWHVATGTAGPFSCGLGVYADGAINNQNDAPGTNPRFFLAIRGGSTSSIQEVRKTLTTNAVLGQQYAHEFRMTWATYPSQGHVEWLIDGVSQWSLNAYNMLDDGLGHGFGLYNYRRLCNFNASVYFGRIEIA